MRFIAIILVALLAGCASKSSDTTPSDVSPMPPEPTTVVPSGVDPAVTPKLKLESNTVSKTHPVTVTTSHAGGCGSRGGPGYRLPNGKCASWHHSGKHRH
jgi:hypothetical protein